MSNITSFPNTVDSTSFNFQGMTSVYHGKVRDVYVIEDKIMVMVVSDRISAFDVIMPRSIPFKGQVLNQLAAYFLNATKDICSNWLIDTPDPNVAIGIMCKPYKIEMVVRGYLTGHAWREYADGKRIICGVAMPDGMKENEAFPSPIITPTTKSHVGHDMDISREEIIAQGIVPEDEYIKLENYSLALYERGSKMADEKGLILVDTKYEFGKANDKIFIIDEINTPDSSRYFYADEYLVRLNKNEPQRQLSKEFLRQWLILNNFQGLDGQSIPEFTDEFVIEVSERYIELYQKITGKVFERTDSLNALERIESNVSQRLTTLLSGI
jgi:phosphoribosylaminoimidazole-succinocarboxamide synthase